MFAYRRVVVIWCGSLKAVNPTEQKDVTGEGVVKHETSPVPFIDVDGEPFSFLMEPVVREEGFPPTTRLTGEGVTTFP